MMNGHRLQLDLPGFLHRHITARLLLLRCCCCRSRCRLVDRRLASCAARVG